VETERFREDKKKNPNNGSKPIAKLSGLNPSRKIYMYINNPTPIMVHRNTDIAFKPDDPVEYYYFCSPLITHPVYLHHHTIVFHLYISITHSKANFPQSIHIPFEIFLYTQTHPMPPPPSTFVAEIQKGLAHGRVVHSSVSFFFNSLSSHTARRCRNKFAK
jgi:hypothetical protein